MKAELTYFPVARSAMRAQTGKPISYFTLLVSFLTFKGAVGPRRVAREAGCSPPERLEP